MENRKYLCVPDVGSAVIVYAPDSQKADEAIGRYKVGFADTKWRFEDLDYDDYPTYTYEFASQREVERLTAFAKGLIRMIPDTEKGDLDQWYDTGDGFDINLYSETDDYGNMICQLQATAYRTQGAGDGFTETNTGEFIKLEV